MPSGNDIEPQNYNVEFNFAKNGEQYKLKIHASEAMYDIEQNYIRIEGAYGRVKYLATSHVVNSKHYSEVEDLLRNIFTQIVKRTDKLMKSKKLLEKIKV